MNANEWARLKEWFGEAIEAKPDQLRDIYAAADAASADLGGELRALVREHQNQALHTVAVLAGAPPQVEAHPPEGPVGGEVGPYRLLRELGRGGTGLVFLAERGDDEFHRQVALKVLRYIAWDRPSREMLTAERGVLAHLQHPNIAALLDWGATEDGTPWLATEYVEGRPIDAFCRERQCDLVATLALFEQVCEAVQYAHRHVVVHRDLKPANILVTESGQVKLLDFGISKPPGDREQPGAGGRRFTPSYASPEQIEGAPVTATSDVYALGLVLYELLAGAPPFSNLGLEGMVRRLDGTPPPPSATPGLTRARQRRLRGDLDCIVLRAIARDPERRYPSVEQLLADLARFRGGFPVLAAQARSGRRALKFVRRHALPVALGAFAIVALLAGATAAIYNARVARREQQRAERRFNDVKSLAHWVIFDAHDAIRRVPGTLALRRQLLANAVRYLDRLNAEHSKDDSLSKEVAQAYLRVGYDLGGLAGTNVGDTAASMRNYRAALGILDGLWARHPDDEWVGAERFAAVYNLSMMINDPASGMTLAGRYVADDDAWRARDAGAPPLQAAELLHSALGRTLRATGDLNGALTEFDKAESADALVMPLTRTDNSPRPMFGTWLDRSQSYFDHGLTEFARAETLLEMGRAGDALAASGAAHALFGLSLSQGLGGPSDQRMAAREHGLRAQALWELHDASRLDEALAEARLEMSTAVANTSDGTATAQRDMAEAHRHMGEILLARGDRPAALDHFKQATVLINNLADSDPAFLMNRYLQAGMLNDYGNAMLGGDGPRDRAVEILRQAAAIAEQGRNEAPSWVEMLREAARAQTGIARATGAPQAITAARADWAALHKKSPLNRRYRDEELALTVQN